VVFAAQQSGVASYSLDNGATWTTESNRGLGNDQARSWAVSGETLYAAIGRNGLRMSHDRGVTWTTAENGIAPRYAMSVAADDGGVYAGFNGPGGGVFMSDDDGQSWARLQSVGAARGISITTRHVFVYGNTLVRRSDDRGATWITVGETTSDLSQGSKLVEAANGNLYLVSGEFSQLSIAAPSNAQRYNIPGVFRSADDGESWERIGFGHSETRAAVAVGDVAFIGVSRPGPVGGIHAYHTAHSVWLDVSDGLPDVAVWSLATDGETIYAGTDAGVFRAPASQAVAVEPRGKTVTAWGDLKQ
jgi:photosystem II stability/assembly factor-like uncharacterized protein